MAFNLLYMCVFSILMLIGEINSFAVEKSPRATFEVVIRNFNDPDYGGVNVKHFFVTKKYINGQIDKKFTEIKCRANDYNGPGKCIVVNLPDEKFLLADCFMHNTVGYSCRLLRFNSDGRVDPTFKPHFESDTKKIVGGDAEYEIKGIEKISFEKELIRLEGSFISPLVGRSQKQATADDEIGDSYGKCGIVFLKKDGQFDSFIHDKKVGKNCAK